jgi:hypothetical protein
MLGESGRRLSFLRDHEIELGIGHTVAGNPNRFRSGLVRLRRDDEWVYKMRGRDRALVMLLTLPLLARYGYPVFIGDSLAG